MKQEIKVAIPSSIDPGYLLIKQMREKSYITLDKFRDSLKDNILYPTEREKEREIKHQQTGMDYWDQYWCDVYDGLKTVVPDTEWRLRVFSRLQDRNRAPNTNHRYYNAELDCYFDHSALVKPLICGYRSYIPSNLAFIMTCCKLQHHETMDKEKDRQHGEWQRLES